MNGQTFCLLHAKLTFNHQWVYHMSSRLSVDVRGNRHTSLPSDKLQYTVLCPRSTKLPLELLGNKAKKSFPLIKISSAIPCSSFHVKVLPLLTKVQLPEHRCHSWQSEITFFVRLTTTAAFLPRLFETPLRRTWRGSPGQTSETAIKGTRPPPLTADSQRLFSHRTDKGLGEMSRGVQIFCFEIRNSVKWPLSVTCWKNKWRGAVLTDVTALLFFHLWDFVFDELL